MNEKEKNIKQYLEKKKSFVLSSELINYILKEYSNVSSDYARKIISNMVKKGLIKSSNPIKFANNNFAYASNDKQTNYNNLSDLIRVEKKSLFRVVCLIKREKVITYNELVKVSGCAIAKLGNNLVIDTIINELIYFKIAEIQRYNGITFIVGQDNKIDLNEKYLYLKKENRILWSLISWLKDINIIDANDIVTFKGEKNNYEGIKNAQLLWDALFFTKTVGISETNKKTIGIIDISTKSVYDWLDVEGFKNRIDIFINSTNDKGTNRKVLPIIFANNISNSARKIIRENNYICIDIKRILGNNYELIISNYIHFIEQEKFDISKFEEIHKQIGENGNYGNIKGILFEYMMGEVFRKIYDENSTLFEHSIKINKREIDYRIETRDENIFIELKSYNKEKEIELGDATQRYTVNWTYKGSYKYFTEKYGDVPDKRCRFCYITTSKFSKDALKKLQELNKGKCKARKLDCFYDREKLISLLKEYKCNKEIELINNFY